jgi:hypothetical protein
MKKAKLLISMVAIVVGVSTALATQPPQNCSGAAQYYFNGTTYVYAGTLGTDYYCASGSGWCTFGQTQTGYLPCQSGTYTPLHAVKKTR